MSAQDWDACACPEAATGRPADPFTTHRFLHALEASGSVGPGTGWEPRYITVEQDGALIAVAPHYVKSHSQGEYIFDHAFAQAYTRAGGQYYPKLQTAVPFTPATGRRFLCKPGYEDAGTAAILQAMAQVARDNRLSSAHVTFCTAEEAARGQEHGFLHRVTEQFHWENPELHQLSMISLPRYPRASARPSARNARPPKLSAAKSAPIPAMICGQSIGMRSGGSTRTPARANGARPT